MAKSVMPGPAAVAVQLLLLAVAWSAPGAAAQVPAAPTRASEDDEVLKAGPTDPYTNGEPKAMAAAGVVRYAPFPWGNRVGTADIEHVLGVGRILWLETAHCRIGSSLKTIALPQDPEKRRYLYDELQLLKQKLPRIDDHPKNLDPWLRLHLYAQQAEDLYSDFQKRLCIDTSEFTGGGPPNGNYLGLPDKYLLLLFQRKSDLARYLIRFCGVTGDRSYRCYLDKTDQWVVAVAIEGIENLDDAGLKCFVAFSLVHSFLDGYRGSGHELPPWFSEGLAHWYGRKVPSEFINAHIKDDEAVDPLKRHLWPERVRLRAQHDNTWLRSDQLFALSHADEFNYQAHLMSWSRVDYLMAQSEAKVGRFLQQLKHLPPPTEGTRFQQLQQVQVEVLQQLFGLDAKSFDARWREWVLKTYAKK